MIYIYDVSPYSFDELKEIDGFWTPAFTEGTADYHLYNILKKSKHRTNDPSKAKLFLIPIDFVKLYHRYSKAEYFDILKKIFNKLYSYKTFNNGVNHLIFTHYFQFSPWCYLSKELLPFRQLNLNISNFIATRYEIYNNNNWEIVKKNIVIPYETWINSSNIKKFNYDEWKNRKHLIFSITAELRYSSKNSTTIRHMAIKNPIFKNKGSIGHTISFDKWLEDILNSKFTLVLKGDTPTSHSFYNSLAAGSIPVVISDDFDKVGLPFIDKEIFNDSCIRYKEYDYINNPIGLLNLLENIDKDEIIKLLDKLNYLQKCFLYENPNNIIDELFLNKIEHLLENI